MIGVSTIKRFVRVEDGAAMVEFAFVATLFFLIFFGTIDIGRLAASHVSAEQAAQVAARIAVVRPPACAGVPERHLRPASPTPPLPRFGTSCRSAPGTCATVATVSCAGSATNPTASEIWTRIQPLLPLGTQIDDLRFDYSYDQNLGFLGGPFTPMVTVEIVPPDFSFVSPLGAMAAALGATGSASRDTTPVAYRGFSVSLPAEDLAQGDNG